MEDKTLVAKPSIVIRGLCLFLSLIWIWPIYLILSGFWGLVEEQKFALCFYIAMTIIFLICFWLLSGEYSYLLGNKVTVKKPFVDIKEYLLSELTGWFVYEAESSSALKLYFYNNRKIEIPLIGKKTRFLAKTIIENNFEIIKQKGIDAIENGPVEHKTCFTVYLIDKEYIEVRKRYRSQKYIYSMCFEKKLGSISSRYFFEFKYNGKKITINSYAFRKNQGLFWGFVNYIHNS